MVQVDHGGGFAGVIPFLLPRDHNTTSANVAQPETAGPITAGVSGIPVVEHTGKARDVEHSADASQQMLLAPERAGEGPSGASTASGSGDSDTGNATRNVSAATAQDDRVALTSRPTPPRPVGLPGESSGSRVTRLPPVYTES